MASEIKDKYGSPTALTISLGGLANNAGRQSTIVDNTTTRFQRVLVFAAIKLGTSPTANTGVFFHLIRDDGSATPLRTDGAGATDALITVVNARQIGALSTGTAPATGTVLTGEFPIDMPGPKWGLIVVNSTGAALDATGTNHTVEFVGIDPEAQ